MSKSYEFTIGLIKEYIDNIENKDDVKSATFTLSNDCEDDRLLLESFEYKGFGLKFYDGVNAITIIDKNDTPEMIETQMFKNLDREVSDTTIKFVPSFDESGKINVIAIATLNG